MRKHLAFLLTAVAVVGASSAALAGGPPAVTVVSDSITCSTSVTQLPDHRLDSGWAVQNNGAVTIFIGTSGMASSAGNWNVPAGKTLGELPFVNSNKLYCVTASSTAPLAIFGGRGSN